MLSRIRSNSSFYDGSVATSVESGALRPGAYRVGQPGWIKVGLEAQWISSP